MKLSEQTNEILNNFAFINSNMLFRRGNKQRTVNLAKSVLAIANISEEFPREFAIYDLSQFLGILRTFEDPDLNFTDKNIKITNGGNATAYYTYTNKESIISAPDKDISLTSTDVDFNLDAEALSGALKVSSVLELPEIAFVGRDGNMYLSALNHKDTSSHLWERLVGKSKNNYSMIFRTENIVNILKRDYEVSISSKGISKFTSKTGDITYYIAIETTSKYDT